MHHVEDTLGFGINAGLHGILSDMIERCLSGPGGDVTASRAEVPAG